MNRVDFIKYFEFQNKVRTNENIKKLYKNFNRLSPVYDKRFGNYLPNNKSINILDVPCGFGNIYIYLRSKGYSNIDCVDLDHNKVKICNSNGIPSFCEDAFVYLEEKKNFYEVIISLDFIEHIEKGSVLNFLQLCNEALKKDGILILRTPCAESPFFGMAAFNDITHKWCATSGVLNELLKMSEFKRINIYDEFPVPYKILNLIRFITYKVMVGILNSVLNFAGIGFPKIWTPNMWCVAIK